MQGIKIKDSIRAESGYYLSFDLKEIFVAIGDSVLSSTWRCYDVECTGENAGELYKVSDEEQNISGDELLRVVSGIDQTIDGEFEAFYGEGEPWLVVKAVDSSWFEVWSHDTEILERVRKSFREVSDLSADAA
jgi:hypothetical protein